MPIIKKIKMKRQHKLIVMQWDFRRIYLRRKAWIMWQPITYKRQEELQQFKTYLMIHNGREEMRETGGYRTKYYDSITRLQNSSASQIRQECHSI